MVDFTKVRLTALGGSSDWSEEGLKPSELVETFKAALEVLYADNTGGSSTSTTETDLATITISQDDLNDNASIVINSGIRGVTNNVAGGGDFTWRLYVNGSVVKTITESLSGNGSGTFKIGTGSAITYIATGLDSTAGDIIVKVTGQTGTTSVTTKCDGLTVVGYNR